MKTDEDVLKTGKCSVCGLLFSIIDLNLNKDDKLLCQDCTDKLSPKPNNESNEDWSKYLV